MTLNIELTGAVEHALFAQAAAQGQDVTSFVREFLTEQFAPVESAPPSVGAEDFAARLQETIRRHGVRCGQFDDSRESIYAGRGE